MSSWKIKFVGLDDNLCKLARQIGGISPPQTQEYDSAITYRNKLLMVDESKKKMKEITDKSDATSKVADGLTCSPRTTSIAL